jgi:N-acetyl sugar amidotransferase
MESKVSPDTMQKINISKKYNLPTEVKYCKRCVISNQRPRIVFDEEGICNACHFADYKKNQIDWNAREKELCKLLDQHRSKDGEHDIIVPSSGGKDSGYVAHILKHEYGMNPLTVTWAPHIYTDVGWKNFQGLIHSGLDNIMATPNGAVHRRLTLMNLREIGEPFQPFIYGQTLFPLHMALKYGIKLVFYGENGEAEYGGEAEAWDIKCVTMDEFSSRFFSQVPVEHWLEKGFTKRDLAHYLPPDPVALQNSGIERHFFGYYKKWMPQENFYYCSKHADFEPNPEGRSEGTYSKYASLDDKTDGFHYYFMLLKFGIGRATSDAAHEIRDGHITREEAIALVNRYDTEFPKKNFQEFLDYCDINEDEFWEIAEVWRNTNLWEQNGNEWVLKNQIK